MNVTFAMIEAIGNILHTGMNAIPPEYASIVTSANFGTFRQNTPDATRYADIAFTDGKVLRFVTQNKNKRYEPNNPKVQNGQAQVGQLKPYAIQALGGAQITWVIANPFAPNNQQSFLGHVFNGVWKPKQDNAYTPATTPPAYTPPMNVAPGTYVPSQPDPGYADPNTGYVDPNVSAPAVNPGVAAIMPLLMKMLKDIENNKPVEQAVDQAVTVVADDGGLNI